MLLEKGSRHSLQPSTGLFGTMAGYALSVDSQPGEQEAMYVICLILACPRRCYTDKFKAKLLLIDSADVEQYGVA